MTRVRMLLAAIALFCLSSATEAQILLQHKIPDGEKSSAVTKMKVSQTLKIAGMEVVTSSEQKVTISSQNGKRGDDGRIAVKQKIDALTVNIEVAGQQLSFDSAQPDAPPPGTAIDALLDVFKVTAKSEWTTNCGQDNRVISIEGRDAALKSLSEELQAAVKNQYEAGYLVKAANNELAKIPSKPVKKGDVWTVESEVRLEGGQTLTFKTTYRYEGVVDQDGKSLHKIVEETTDVSYAMDADAPAALKYISSELKVAESNGTILFDQEAGRVVTENSKLHITGEIKLEAGGMELPAALDLTFESSIKRI